MPQPQFLNHRSQDSKTIIMTIKPIEKTFESDNFAFFTGILTH